MTDDKPGADKDLRPDEGRFARSDLGALIGVVKAATTIAAELESELRESGVGLRANEFDALVFLTAQGPMRPSELIRLSALCASAATLHAVLSRLEDRGLVERGPHPDHERGVLYGVTAEGAATIESVWPAVERHIVNRFAGHFSAEELAQLVHLTGRI